jgi:tetratricopeptide (TPR) repeat protein
MDQFTAHLDRGWDLVSRGDFAGALLSAQKSLEIDAESPEAHNLIGYVHQAEGRADDALDHYKQALAIDDTYVEAMLNAAEVMIHSLRDVDNGLAMIDDALDLAEGDDEIADALLLKFDALMQSEDRDAAKAALERLPEGPFENEQLDFLVGRALYETGDLDGAERHLVRATEREDAPGDAFYYFALVREGRGDLRGATLSFLRARDVDLRAPRPAWALSATSFEKRVLAALHKVSAPHSQLIDGALVVVSDLPGPEVVAEGVDPHVGVLLDDLQDGSGRPAAPGSMPVRVGRVFVYQRNIERFTNGVGELEDEILQAVTHELTMLSDPQPEDR